MFRVLGVEDVDVKRSLGLEEEPKDLRMVGLWRSKYMRLPETNTLSDCWGLVSLGTAALDFE
jgi:hypothetical protein